MWLVLLECVQYLKINSSVICVTFVCVIIFFNVMHTVNLNYKALVKYNLHTGLTWYKNYVVGLSASMILFHSLVEFKKHFKTVLITYFFTLFCFVFLNSPSLTIWSLMWNITNGKFLPTFYLIILWTM